MATKNKDEDFDERLYKLEREGRVLPKGGRPKKQSSQMDTHINDSFSYFTVSKHADVRSLLSRG